MHLPPEALSVLKSLNRLAWLDLRDTPVSDESLQALGELPSLSNLCLSRTGVTATGLESLSSAPLLRDLVIKECGQIGDPAVLALEKFKNLKHLDIRGTNITEQGFCVLTQDLPSCKIRH